MAAFITSVLASSFCIRQKRDLTARFAGVFARFVNPAMLMLDEELPNCRSAAREMLASAVSWSRAAWIDAALASACEPYERAERGVRHAAEEAYDYAEDAYARGSHALRRGTREVGQQVAEYPLAALLIAGIAGFGLGLLVSARRD